MGDWDDVLRERNTKRDNDAKIHAKQANYQGALRKLKEAEKRKRKKQQVQARKLARERARAEATWRKSQPITRFINPLSAEADARQQENKRKWRGFRNSN